MAIYLFEYKHCVKHLAYKKWNGFLVSLLVNWVNIA